MTVENQVIQWKRFLGKHKCHQEPGIHWFFFKTRRFRETTCGSERTPRWWSQSSHCQWYSWGCEQLRAYYSPPVLRIGIRVNSTSISTAKWWNLEANLVLRLNPWSSGLKKGKLIRTQLHEQIYGIGTGKLSYGGGKLRYGGEKLSYGRGKLRYGGGKQITAVGFYVTPVRN